MAESKAEITFNPNDFQTAHFLRQIGLREEEIATGRVSEDHARVRFELLTSSLDREISPQDVRDLLSYASKGLERIGAAGNKSLIWRLFQRGTCPSTGEPPLSIYGDDRDEEATNHFAKDLLWILARGKPLQFSFLIEFFGGGVRPVYQCPYSRSLPIPLYRGIHFSEEGVPGPIAVAGRAVGKIQIGEERSGSAIVISDRGHILTARHVFLDDEGLFRREGAGPSPVLILGKRRYEIHPDQIVAEDRLRDLLILQIPAANGLPHLEVTRQAPAVGEQIWSIGFPALMGEIPSDDQRYQRTYTTGIFERASGNDLETSALNYGGSSGGAIIDSEGRLISFVSGAPVKKELEGILSSRTLGISGPRLDLVRPWIERHLLQGEQSPWRGKSLTLQFGAAAGGGWTTGQRPSAESRFTLTPLDVRVGNYTSPLRALAALELKAGGSPIGPAGRVKVGVEAAVSHFPWSSLILQSALHAGVAMDGNTTAGVELAIFLRGSPNWGGMSMIGPLASILLTSIGLTADYESQLGEEGASQKDLFSFSLALLYPY